MANTKAFLIVILFAALLISSYEVSAREIADPQSTRQTQSVQESKQSYAGGYGNPGGGYGNPGGGGGGYGNPGGGYGNPGGGYPNPPPRQKMAKVVEEKRN